MRKTRNFPEEYKSLQDFLLHCQRPEDKIEPQKVVKATAEEDKRYPESYTDFAPCLCVGQRPKGDIQPPQVTERYFYERNPNTPLPSELPPPDRLHYIIS